MTLTPYSHDSSSITKQSKPLHVHTAAESTTSDTTEATTTSNLNTAAITSEHAESTNEIQFIDQKIDMKEPGKVITNVADTCTPAGREKEVHIGWDQFKDNIKVLLSGITGKCYIIFRIHGGVDPGGVLSRKGFQKCLSESISEFIIVV